MSFAKNFRISWCPVVLTLQKSDVLESTRMRLEEYDIKTVIPYLASDTTHLVSQKRNVSKGLQALINGKYIVTDAFIDAIVVAANLATSADEEGNPLNSSLEDDYDGNWPEAMHFLPGPGKEPKPRAADLFAPSPERQNLFEGYTFVMADKAQYATLAPPISEGGGKVVFFDMKLGVTELQEFVRFVKSVAGEKGVGELEDGGEGKGVVVVRWRSKDEALNEWGLNFIREMDRELGLRSVEQNEFLDAILTNNASVLRQPLLEEEEDQMPLPVKAVLPSSVRLKQNPSSSIAPKPPHTSSIPPPEPPLSQPASREPSASIGSQPPEDVPKSALRHRLRRTIAQPRFKGFDDFDASQLPPRSQLEPLGSPAEEDPFSKTQHENKSQSQLDNNADSQSLFLREDSQPAPEPSGSRKRRAPFSDDEEDAVDPDAMVDALLPAAAAMKKRRLEEERAGIMQPPAKPVRNLGADSISTSFSKAAKKKPPKEVDVRAAAKTHAASMDARSRQRDEEAHDDDDQLDEHDISSMRDLAIVEEMEVAPRALRTADNRAGGAGENPRWDERWNGRQNFKCFRKRRPNDGFNDDDNADVGVALTNRARKVIVPLEEAKKKEYGIGDTYWLEDSERQKEKEKEKRRRARSSGAGTQTQSQSQTQSRHHRVAPIVLEDDDDDDDNDNNGGGDDDGESLPDRVTTGIARNAERHAEDNATPTTLPATGPQATATKGKGKRPAAAAPPAKAPPAKKQATVKPMTMTTKKSRYANNDDDDDSEEEAMQFKFRRER